jgi:hypothetical protein
VDEACSTHGREEKLIKNCRSKVLKERENLRDLGIVGRIMSNGS